jgi:hypothetical protein
MPPLGIAAWGRSRPAPAEHREFASESGKEPKRRNRQARLANAGEASATGNRQSRPVRCSPPAQGMPEPIRLETVRAEVP